MNLSRITSEIVKRTEDAAGELAESRKDLLQGVLKYAARVLNADPADYVSADGSIMPVSELPAEHRKMAAYIVQDGKLYAMPPDINIKNKAVALAFSAISEARASDIALDSNPAEGAAEEPVQFNLIITDNDRDAGA